jgi:hypothetical protein
MLISLAYLYEAIQARRGLGKVGARKSLSSDACYLPIAGIALKVMSSSRLAL